MTRPAAAALLFFVVWPAVTVLLYGWVMWNGFVLWRLRRAGNR